MRNLKKVLALVIAFSMMFSVVAFADFADVAEDADYAGAVELLSALEIMVGDDLGNFNPDKTISRAEMAAIVCRIKGLENSANAAKGATSFTDVAADHWASGYVNIANQNGIIAGYGDGKFGPEDEVTYEAAVKMLVCALGFEPMAAQKGGWPTGYLVVANNYKVTDGVSGSTRGDIATLVYNALSTPMMDQTTYGADAEFEILDGKKDREYKTLLTEMDIYIATGIVGTKEVDDIDFIVSEDSDDLEFEEGDEETFEINGSNIADYQYQSVDVYVKKDSRKDYQVVAVVPGVIGETFTVLSDDIKGMTEKGLEYYVDAANSSKTKEIKLEIYDVVYNKNADTTLDVEAIAEMDDVQMVFIENTGDTKYDVLIATKYTSEVLEFVDAEKDKMTLGGRTVEFDFEDEEKTFVFVDDAGNELELADFAEDDVVAWYADNEDALKSAEFIKVIKLTDAAVTGIVEETFVSNGDDYIVVDGTELKIDPELEETFSVGDEGIFYVGMTGKVVSFDGSAAGKNYAYILEAELSDSAFAADKWQVKLLTKEDGVVIFDMTDDASDDMNEYLGGNNDPDNFELGDAVAWTEGTIEADRLITYKTNAKGEIKSFEAAGDIEAIDDNYNADTQIIDKKALEDDIVIFMLNEEKADNVTVVDISYLVDEGAYTGAVFADEDDEYAVMLVSVGDAAFDSEAGFAIVTKVTDTKNAEDDDVVKVSFVQGEEEGSVIFDDDSTAKSACDITDLGVGDVFIYNATADGVVTNYAVIAEIVDAEIVLCEDMTETKIVSLLGEDAEIYVGYIANTERKKNSKGETIELDNGETVLVKAGTFKYTYNDAGRNIVIETGDFLAEEAYYFDADNKEYTPVLVRLDDGQLIDIYTSTERQTVIEA